MDAPATGTGSLESGDGTAPSSGLSPRLLQLGDSSLQLQIGRFNRTQLQTQERRKTDRDPGVKFARIDFGDQAIQGVLHCHSCFQSGQWIGVPRGNRALASASDPAQLRGFVGIGVKKAQAACGGCRATGLACLSPAFTTTSASMDVVHTFSTFSFHYLVSPECT